MDMALTMMKKIPGRSKPPLHSRWPGGKTRARVPGMNTVITAISLALLSLAVSHAAPQDEEAGIRKAALNYIEGWYAGDAARMESALHPELAKRMVSTDGASGRSRLNQLGALQLVQSTRAGGGSRTPKERQLKEVTVLDRFGNAAVAKIVASDWVDYLELAKFDGDWKIVNVLWELKPKTAN
jgi:hypothetical protein